MALSITVKRKDFIKALASFQSITNKKGTLAILSYILVETQDSCITLTATDLEVGLRLSIPAEIQNPGSITLHSRKVFEIVRESGVDIINIEETKNNWLTIKSGLSTYNLAGITGDEFPVFYDYKKDTFISLETYIFIELIEKTIYSVAREQENIYSLTSVLFKKEKIDEKNYLIMVSSDGHRLSVMRKEVAVDLDDFNIKDVNLISKNGVQEWKNFCEDKDEVKVCFTDKQIVIRKDQDTLVIRIKREDFPEYSTVLKAVKCKNSFSINRISFLESLKRMNIFSEEVFNTIQLNIDKDRIILSSHNANFGDAKDEQYISYKGPPLILGFNCRYFIETLQVMRCEEVEVYIDSNKSPCLMKSEEDKGFVSVIMPMKL